MLALYVDNIHNLQTVQKLVLKLCDLLQHLHVYEYDWYIHHRLSYFPGDSRGWSCVLYRERYMGRSGISRSDRATR
jgi:hypothetical protein